MKNLGYIFKLTAVLLLITVVVAGLLGFVNHLTEDKIAENTAKKARQAMQSVLPAESYEPIGLSDENKADGISEAFKCEGGYVVRLNAGGFGGAIDMMVGIDETCSVVGISIVSHAETASLGANCTRDDWRTQFVGTTGDLSVDKDGGTIDSLTGATVTSRAVTKGVNTAVAFVKEVLG